MIHFNRRIGIDCSSDPLNPAPVVATAFAELVRIRQRNTSPAFILAGENGASVFETLFPYAAALQAGLLGNTPVPGLGQMQFTCGYPHDLIQKNWHLYAEAHPDRVDPAADSPTQQNHVAEIMCDYGNRHVPAAHQALYRAFADHQLPLRPVDASTIYDKSLPFLDSQDALTRRFMPADTPVPAEEAEGLRIRNLLTHYLLSQNGLKQGSVTFHHCGTHHLFGHQPSRAGWKDSLTGQFNPLAQRGLIQVIALIRSSELDNLPATAKNFCGTVIAYSGAKTSASVEEASDTRLVLKAIHGALPT